MFPTTRKARIKKLIKVGKDRLLKEWDLDNVPVNSGSLKILRSHLLKSNVMLIFAIVIIRVSIKIVKDIVTEQFSKRYTPTGNVKAELLIFLLLPQIKSSVLCSRSKTKVFSPELSGENTFVFWQNTINYLKVSHNHPTACPPVLLSLFSTSSLI